MKKIVMLSISIAIMFVLIANVFATSSVPEPVMKSAESVVKVTAEYATYESSGSGFVIKSGKGTSLIATNNHVVTGNPYKIYIWLDNDEKITAEVCAASAQKDICVLEINNISMPAAISLAAEDAQQGEAVYAIGFPAAADSLSDKEAHTSSEATITDGIISAVRMAKITDYGSPAKILQINAAINSGNSGGPLFNINGEVIGINTYGIENSQGIFGAIAVGELKNFLEDNSLLDEKSSQNTSFIWIIGVGVLLLIVGIIVLLIVLKNRKRRATMQRREKYSDIPLRSYMKNHPNGIDKNQATAMLLPVALRLRDLHQNGTAHLEVSPDTITISEKGAQLPESTHTEERQYISGFAAPEIYTRKSAGGLSDIYSFCAVLSYVYSGEIPDNSLSRSESEKNNFPEEETEHEEELVGDRSFEEILQKGMSINPADRYASMQEIILQLTQYNLSPFAFEAAESTVDTETPAKNTKTKKKKNGKAAKIIIITASCLLVVVGILFSIYYGTYTKAKACAEAEEFSKAERYLIVPGITELHDQKLIEYTAAGKMLESRQYEEAKQAFSELNGYLNADNLVYEANYRYAAQLANSNDFTGSIEIYQELGEKDYRDSKEKYSDVRFRYANFLLYESADYSHACLIFGELSNEGYEGAEESNKEAIYLWGLAKAEQGWYTDAYELLEPIKNYSDVAESLEALKEAIYMEGQNYYYENKFEQAEEKFVFVDNYKDSEKYLKLISLINYGEFSVFDNWTKMKDLNVPEGLMDMFYFENTADLILKYSESAPYYLKGSWHSADGYYYFTMDNDEYINYNLPWFNYGDYYTYEDSCCYFYPEDNPGAKKLFFEFTAITPDSMEVYCAKNGARYVMYRDK